LEFVFSDQKSKDSRTLSPVNHGGRQMKTFNTQEMVQEAVSEIQKIAPKHSHVEIDVKEDPIGNFTTHIRLDTKQRTYFAKKGDMFLYKSFSKALRAIKAQIQKRKINHETVRSNKYYVA
jgi:ribosome-associated translation inhibitor RaiA